MLAHQVGAVADQRRRPRRRPGAPSARPARPGSRRPCTRSRPPSGSAPRAGASQSLWTSTCGVPDATTSQSRGPAASLSARSACPWLMRSPARGARSSASSALPALALRAAPGRATPPGRASRRSAAVSARSAELGVGHERQRRPACGRRERTTLSPTKRTSGSWKSELRAGGEVDQPGADAQDQVGLAGERVGRARAGDADPAQRELALRSAPFPAEVSATGHAEPLGEPASSGSASE